MARSIIRAIETKILNTFRFLQEKNEKNGRHLIFILPHDFMAIPFAGGRQLGHR